MRNVNLIARWHTMTSTSPSLLPHPQSRPRRRCDQTKHPMDSTQSTMHSKSNHQFKSSRVAPPIPVFIPSSPCLGASKSNRLQHATICKRRPRTHALPMRMDTAQKNWPIKSSPLDQEEWQNRYVDLRTMKVVYWDDAHIAYEPTPDATFGAFQNSAAFVDALENGSLTVDMFTNDTIPLSESQQLVVLTLLSRRSVLYMSAAGEERDGIVLDIAMRNRLWNGVAVFCASCRRSAEAMHTLLCAQMGLDRSNEILLDLGDGSQLGQQAKTRGTDAKAVSIIVTLPQVLLTNLVTCDDGGWIDDTSLVFIDDFDTSTLSVWEEIILAMPSRIVMCLFSRELDINDRELVPLWIESIQNSIIPISPQGATSLLDRIERPQSFPMLRTFAYNAARHESPVQVSLTLLKDIIQKELQNSSSNFVPTYSECLLHGIKMIMAENPAELKFGSVEEAEYADAASLIVADAKRTEAVVRSRSKRRTRTKRKERTGASLAAARKRREAAFADSLLFPAIVITKGKREAESAAFAVRNALGNRSLLWDDDSKQHLEELVEEFKQANMRELNEAHLNIIETLTCGIGIVHDGTPPALRLFAEELFRGGLISALVADSHLGSSQLLTLPRGKSVLVESGVLASCDDVDKGFITASTTASLAGRTGIDDVGNLVVLWYDESVDDESAGYDIASTLLIPLFMERMAKHTDITKMPEQKVGMLTSKGRRITGSVLSGRDSIFSPLSSSYGGVLRSLRRYGVDGYRDVLDHTMQAHKGWLKRAALHATLEKMEAEKGIIEEQLDSHDWTTIGEHQRRQSKFNELSRVFEAMQNRYDSVIRERLLKELKQSSPGRIIGLVGDKVDGVQSPWQQNLLIGDHATDQAQIAKDSQEEKKGASTITETHPKRDSVSAGVFVALINLESGSKAASKQKWRVVTVLADGMWTMLPVSDVVAMSHSESDMIANVDLLMMPHQATFDEDSSTGWAKCHPIDESEQEAVSRIADQLIARVASEKRPDLVKVQIPEFEAQRSRVEIARGLYENSVWYNREEELLELRRLRRRSAELGDEKARLQSVWQEVEDGLHERQNARLADQAAVLAVLEDCHALSAVTEARMEMTPIGELGSVVPGEYPVFTAACLALIDDAATLEAAEFIAFVSLVCSSRGFWSNKSDEFDFMVMSRADDLQSDSDEELEGILPQDLRVCVGEILHALHELHRRHVDESSSIGDIAPQKLDWQIARAAHAFASGATFAEAAQILNNDGGMLVRMLWRVGHVIELIVDEHTGEFSDEMQTVARKAGALLARWPVREDGMRQLIENGVVAKRWNGDGYDRWWRGARDRLLSEFGEVKIDIASG